MMKSLKQVFESLLAQQGAPEVKVFDYTDPGDFNALWSMQELSEQILILWSRIPPDFSISPVDASSHLTPLHWSACLLKAAEGGLSAKCPPHRITILDLCPWTNHEGPLYELFRDLDPDRIPWIRVIQPGDLVVGNASSAGVEQEIPDTLNLKEQLFPDYTDTQKGYLDKWTLRNKALLTSVRHELSSPSAPDNRHAIANLMGPMILAGKPDPAPENKPKDSHPDHRKALQALLHSTGFFVEDSNNLDPIDRLPTPPNLEIVLIDDQARHGWDTWLEKESGELLDVAPGFTSIDEIACIEEWIDDLIALLNNRSPEAPDKWVHDLRFRLSYPSQNSVGLVSPNPQILFLDLRLFAGRPITEECRFYLKVVELWKALAGRREIVNNDIESDLEKREFPWLDDLGSTIIRVEEACKSEKTELKLEAHLDALTLFPRVLAQLDLSFPIVIFSSTTQAAALKKFAPYGNIITAFAKPAFFAAGPDGVRERSREGILHALQEALRLLRARNKGQSISGLNKADLDPNLDLLEKSGPDVHVELYVDETGTAGEDGFTLGGLVAVHQNPNDAKDVANSFEDLCVEKGLRYFEFPLLEPRVASADVLKKSADNGERQLNSALSQAGVMGIRPQLGFLRIRPTKEMAYALQGSKLHDSKLHDSDFRGGLSAMLEIVLAETIPEIVRGLRPQKISIAIYVGTRILDESREGDFDYSYSTEIFHRRLRSLGGGDIFPIILPILENHKITPNIERCIGVALPYKSERSEERKKTEVDRILDRKAETVYRFSMKDDIDCSDNPTGISYGEIVGRNGPHGWIRIPGNGIDCRFDLSFQRGQRTPEVGDFAIVCQNSIRYNTSQKGEVKAVCEIDRIVNSEEFDSWKSLLTWSVKEDVCPNAERNDLRPDFRALHYVADQLVSVRTGFLSSVLEQPSKIGQFSDDLRYPLRDSIDASRLTSVSDLGNAMAKFCVDEIQEPDAIHSARMLIGRRLCRALPKMTGRQYLDTVYEFSKNGGEDHFEVSHGNESEDVKREADLIFQKVPNSFLPDRIRSSLISKGVTDLQIESISRRVCQGGDICYDVYLHENSFEFICEVIRNLEGAGWRVYSHLNADPAGP